MFDFLKKNSKSVKTDKKDQLNDMIFDAQLELSSARRKNEDVILIEKKNIQHYRDLRKNGNDHAETAEELAMMKLKKAYYAIIAIRETEYKLTEVYSTDLLYSAMNDYTRAMKLINGFRGKSEKPHLIRYKWQHKKLFGEEGVDPHEAAKVEKMYLDPDDVNEFVSDEIVNSLLEGETLAACLDGSVGVKIPYDDFLNMDLTELADGEKIDLSDVKEKMNV